MMQMLGKTMNGMEGMDMATGDTPASEPINTATDTSSTPAPPGQTDAEGKTFL